MDKKTEFEFVLSKPIKVAKQGEHADEQSLLLTAPTAAHRRITIKLKQGFFRALDYHKKNGTEHEEEAKKAQDKDEEITAQEFMSLMYMSDTDMDQYSEHFKKLLLAPGIAVIGENTKLTEPLFNQMQDDDVDQLMGEYLVNFFVGSMMSQLNKS